MGTEKGLVLYQNKPFVKWSLEAAEAFTKKIQLVTQNHEYEKFGYPLLKDAVKEKGPVGGILTALQNSATEWNLILSCDMPGISASVLKELIEEADPETAVSFLSEGDKDYPLAGIYHQKCLQAFTKSVQNEELRLMSIIKKLNFQRIEIPLFQKLFLNNINNKKELEQLIQSTL